MSRVSKLSRTSAILVAAGAASAAMTTYNIYRARKVEREYPPAGRFITVNGIRLHYIERGEGPPVVLLHGNMVTAEDFDTSGVLDLVATQHRVIAFDRPGFGYSDRPHGSPWGAGAQADLLRDALVVLGIKRPIVLGHSWGAAVALALALNHPDAVGALVSAVGLLLSESARGRSVILARGDPNPRGSAALFDLASTRQTIAAAAPQGNVRASPRASQLHEGLCPKHVGTPRADPRGESRRRRHDSERHRVAAPLSGIDTASCYHGGHEGSRRR